MTYFDLCFFNTNKPSFFISPENTKFFLINNKKELEELGNEINDVNFSRIKNGYNLICGGSFKIIEDYFKRELNKKNLKCIFIGDNIIEDCMVTEKLYNWFSILITDMIHLNSIGEFPENEFINFYPNEDRDKNIFSEYYKEDCILALPNIDDIKYFI